MNEIDAAEQQTTECVHIFGGQVGEETCMRCDEPMPRDEYTQDYLYRAEMKTRQDIAAEDEALANERRSERDLVRNWRESAAAPDVTVAYRENELGRADGYIISLDSRSMGHLQYAVEVARDTLSGENREVFDALLAALAQQPDSAA